MQKQSQVIKTFGLAVFLSFWALNINTEASAKVYEQNSQTTQVTAYQGMAMVTREVKLAELSPGQHVIRVHNLPAGMNRDSLSIRGSGSASIKIRHTQILPDKEATTPPELQALQKKLDDLEQSLVKARNNEDLNRVHQQIMQQFEQTLQEHNRNDSSKHEIRVKDWEAMVQFTLQHHAQILESQRNTNNLKAQLQESLQQVKQELQAWQESHRGQMLAEISVQVEKAGSANLQVKYLIDGVSWKPAYEAHLQDNQEKIRLIYLGDLNQRTGENWNQVNLTLSSATPMLNLRPPTPRLWNVAPSVPLAKAAGSVQMRQQLATEDEVRDTDAPAPKPVNFMQSQVSDTGVSIRFQLPGEQQIPSSPDSRRLSVATRELDCSTAYKIVPRQSPLAFLEAKIKNNTGLPLLPGGLRTFVNDEFTGSSSSDLIRPGQESRISFGVDRDIQVEWREKERKDTPAGMLGDMEQIDVTYVAEVTNFKKIPVNLRILEPAPHILDKRIKVELIKADPEPTSVGDDQLRTWELKAQPWEKKSIELKYRIRHPKDMQVYF